MNDIESYQWLAQCNAKYGRPKRREEIDPTLPYFEIFRCPMGRYDIRGFNFEAHDNASRMMLWEMYMKQRILPQIKNSICGFYNIELHDSYTYLDKPRSQYRGCLTFSKFKSDNTPVLIPDPYAMQGWGGGLASIKDQMEWKDKTNKVCFYGTTTGSRTPSDNQRINMCLWSLKRPNLYDFKITKIAQMEAADVYAYLGTNKDAVMSPPVSPAEQMKYKYHMVLDGNTCRFDIWHYLTNTVTMKYESAEMLWYYPLLLDKTHYLEVNKDTMEAKMNIQEKEAAFLIENAKRTINKIISPISHMFYLSSVFEYMADNAP